MSSEQATGSGGRAPSTEDAINARREQVQGHLDSHGRSRAAWTGVFICLAGSLIAAVAMVIPVVSLVITGLVVMAVAGPVTIAMSKAGYGQKQHPDQHGKPTPIR